MRLRVAAAYALDRLDRGSRYRSQIMNAYNRLPDDGRDELDRQKRQEELNRSINEEQQLMR